MALGYAEEDGKSVIEFSPAGRGMVLYSGKLVDEKGTAIVPITDSRRVPMYWWPDDLHRCIGQDIYARSLIIGCDIATAGKILADPELDAYLIRETDTVLPEDFEDTKLMHAEGFPNREPLIRPAQETSLELDSDVRRARSSQCAFKQHQVDLTKHVNTVDEGFQLKGPGVTADAKIGEPNFV